MDTLPTTPTVRIIRVRFLEDDVFEGSIPRECYESATVEDFEVEGADGAAAIIQREGLSFDATGTDWAANPDGTVITDYATGEREEVTAHLYGFDANDIAAIVEWVDGP